MTEGSFVDCKLMAVEHSRTQLLTFPLLVVLLMLLTIRTLGLYSQEMESLTIWYSLLRRILQTLERFFGQHQGRQGQTMLRGIM